MKNGTKKLLACTILGGGAILATRSIARLLRSIPIEGRTVVITGGSRGLGLVLAREFVHEGAQVAICTVIWRA